MLLTSENSDCEDRQKIIVSRDMGTRREHRALNLKQEYAVRHYKLDKKLVKQQTCCDFLLTNDTLHRAYFIELKGGNIDEAIPQLENAARICREELVGYEYHYRIVQSKARTHDIKKVSFRKFKDKCGSRLKYQTTCMEEEL